MRMRGKGKLGGRLALGIALVACVAAPQATALSSAKAERQMAHCVDRKREQHGLKPLRVSKAMTEAARYHAKNMAAQNFFDHIDRDGNGPTERVAMFSDRKWFVGENIGAGYRDGQKACQGWMASSGHRANILDPGYDVFGVGFASGGSLGKYYVQVFGERRGN